MFVRKRQTVVGQVIPQVTVERRSAANEQSDRVAVVAQFSEQEVVSRSLNTLLSQLVGASYRVVVVSASPTPLELRFDPEVRDDVTVLRKPNVGYDFGSWAVGLAWDPQIATRRYVVLANDSLVGPFASMRHILESFEASRADVFGLTETTQVRHHLQSYFLGFRDGVIAEPALRRFWQAIQHETDKNRIIVRNEIGLSDLLRHEGYNMSAAFPMRRVGRPGENPTIAGWRRLLDAGFPFVKREIVRSPELAPGGEQVPAVLRRKFRVEVEEWL